MIFASNNNDKLKELQDIFKGYEITSLKKFNIEIDIEEDQDSFYGNALKKAKEVYDVTKGEVIADDSGLSIDILDGWPGVLTNRFLDANWEFKKDYIIRKLDEYSDKRASFICVLVYYNGKDIITGMGEVKGCIVESRGENGFGFDSIFELENGKTLAELSSREKNKCSARYLAIKDLYKKLSDYYKY